MARRFSLNEIKLKKNYIVHNHIYDELVDSEDDIHGIISYSVYKRQKIKFIQDFKESKGKSPKDEDLQAFNDISTSSSQLEFYRSEATILTERFLADVLEADLEERETFFSAKVHTELSSIKPNHLLDITKSALGSFLFVLLTGVLYFSVWSLSTSPLQVFGQIFDLTITPNVQPSNVQPSNVQPSNGQPSNVQPSNGQPSNVQPSNVQPSNVQPSNVQPSNVQPSN